LASGFENVATLDLVLSMQPSERGQPYRILKPAMAEVEAVVRRLVVEGTDSTPSHLYLELLRHGFRHGWDLGEFDLRHISGIVAAQGFVIHPKTGRLTSPGRT